MNRRLQEIKRKVMTFNQELREIDLEEHVDWLIEQAERVQELERQNKRYRKALEFYANEDNWVYGKVQHILRGEKARQALEDEE